MKTDFEMQPVEVDKTKSLLSESLSVDGFDTRKDAIESNSMKNWGKKGPVE